MKHAERSRRVASIVALGAVIGAIVAIVVAGWRGAPSSLIGVVLVVGACSATWSAIRHRGVARFVFGAIAAALVAGFTVTLVIGGLLLDAIVILALLALGIAAARQAFRIHVPLPTAQSPEHPVVIWNPKSGGGKATAAGLEAEAKARGIEPIELRPGDDLTELVRDAVARGADALGAAGGDGTQAVVATIAAELDLPFACIPAGTRNHFALDLGVDRDDVVGALDALTTGGERRVDLAEVNGRVFVNNVSLGVYAQAVQRPEYRGAKIRTMFDTMSESLGDAADGVELRYAGTDRAVAPVASVIMVSNNPYRLDHVLGFGSRPSVADGELGITVLAPRGQTKRARLRQWSAPTFEVDADDVVPCGIDGEALVLEPPLRFAIRPGALRVRVAAHHPGVSPAAVEPAGLLESLLLLSRIAVRPASKVARTSTI